MRRGGGGGGSYTRSGRTNIRPSLPTTPNGKSTIIWSAAPPPLAAAADEGGIADRRAGVVLHSIDPFLIRIWTVIFIPFTVATGHYAKQQY